MSDITLNSVSVLEESAAKPFETSAFQEKWSKRKTVTFTVAVCGLLWSAIIASAWQLF